MHTVYDKAINELTLSEYALLSCYILTELQLGFPQTTLQGDVRVFQRIDRTKYYTSRSFIIYLQMVFDLIFE